MNFWKIVKTSFRYRGTILLCIVTAIGVSVLWGTNLSAVFPFMQITFKGQTMQDWVDGSVAECETRILDFEKQLAEGVSDEKDRALIENKLKIETATLRGYVWLQGVFYAYLPTTPFGTIVLLLAALMFMTILKTAFLVANSVLVAKIANQTIYDVRNQLYDKCLDLELARYSQEGTAVLMSRITNDVGGIGGGLGDVYGKMIREPLKMFVCLGIAIWINWQLFVVTILVLPLIAWAIRALAKQIRNTSRQIMKEVAKLYQTIQETFFGIKIVKCFTLEDHMRQNFHEQGRTIYRKGLRVAFLDVLAKGLVECSGIMLVSIALLVGAWLVLTGNTTLFGIPMSERPLSIEWLVMFYVALLGAADPARKLSDIFTSLQNACAVADRVYELLEAPVKVADPKKPVTLENNSMTLEFRDVNFDYNPDRPVLRKVNYAIPYGRTIAIVGPNGCGKSTLLNLIPRLADPTEGEITLGGVSLRDVRQTDLHSRLGLVSQDAILFDDTVYNNIRYGRFDATEEEIIDAARRANAHEFITEVLPQGYDTPLGPLGNSLSGGQRQRIALARVILRNPQILLLDEATSQIDIESERAIQESLAEFHQGRTVIIVTHRLGILTLADEIVVMENGQITDHGTHEELLARCEFYKNLYREN
ncbi:MAG: ABC transporter ATP-binding protein [Planctomycetia bacterium]|nr:ABC transporter ATP-binding protein [Planctomycetia bacterium]